MMRTFRVRIVRVKERPDWKPWISDHAVVRYLERSFGIDIEELRDRMRTPALKVAIRNGAKSLTFDGVRLVIEGTRVVTVVPLRRQSEMASRKLKKPTRKQRELQEAD